MTPLDLKDAVTWINSKWGYEKSWSDWESHVAEFAPFTVGALKEALHTWYRRGTGRAPKPDQLHKLVSEVQMLRVERGIDNFEIECASHVWADPLPTDPDRRRSCVLCGEFGPVVGCRHHFNRFGHCVYCPETLDVSELSPSAEDRDDPRLPDTVDTGELL